MDWTVDNLLAPLRKAFTYAISEDGKSAPWCEIGQKKIAGLKNDEDNDRLSTISVYKDQTKPFEDTRVNWATEGNQATFNVSGHNVYYDGKLDIADSCISPAHEIGCKMVSANRIAQVLNVTADNFNDTIRCIDVNKYSEELAHDILSSTTAGANALKRHLAKGRKICYGNDYQPPGGIGPLFVKQTMTIKDDKKNNCLSVKSLAEGP